MRQHLTDDTRLKAAEIAKSRNYDPAIDQRPLLPITTEKLYKDVRAGILPPPEKIGSSSVWVWGNIRKAYGLSAPLTEQAG